MRHKYVRFKKAGFFCWPVIDGKDGPVFHSHIKDLVKSKINDDIISAGFFDVVNNKIRCYGHSCSIGKGSIEEDSKLLSQQLLSWK